MLLDRRTGIETTNVELAMELLAGGAKLLVATKSTIRITTLADGGSIELAPPAPITEIRGVAALTDGERIVIDGMAGADEGLWLASLDGSPARKLRDGAYSNMRVSPDGRRVAFNKHGVCVAPLEGGEPSVVVGWSDAPGSPEYQWSPDSTKLAVIVPATGGTHLDVVDATSGAAQRLLGNGRLQGGNGEEGLLWSARYGVLAALQPKGTEQVAELLQVPLDAAPGTTPRVVLRAAGHSLSAMRESGDRIALEEERQDLTLRFGELDASGRHMAGPLTATPLVPSARLPVAYSDDGIVLVYDAGHVLARFHRDGQQDRLLSTAPDENISFVAPRGKGSMIAELQSTDGSCRLEEITPAGETRTLRRGALGCEARVQCPRIDGVPCVARGPRESDYAFFTFDPSTASVTPPFHLVSEAFQPWRLSPDGGTILYTVPRAIAKVTEVRVRDGAERLVDFGQPNIQWMEFAPNGKRLLLTTNNIDEGGASKLVTATLDGHSDVLWESEIGGYVAAPVFAEDGKRFAFFYGRYPGELAFLEALPADAGGP
jgi:hypothetical protein